MSEKNAQRLEPSLLTHGSHKRIKTARGYSTEIPLKEHKQRGLGEEEEDDEEGEAEAAFAVLVEQGREAAAEASRASSSI